MIGGKRTPRDSEAVSRMVCLSCAALAEGEMGSADSKDGLCCGRRLCEM